MMLFTKINAMVQSTNDDTDFFDIIAGVLQKNKLAPFLFLDNVLITSIDLVKANDLLQKRAINIS